MKSDKTNKFMESCRRYNLQYGYISKHIGIKTFEETPKDEESKIRIEIQSKIKELVSKGYNASEIKEVIKDDKYKKYYDFFDNWIVGFVFKEDIKMKNFIKRQVELDKQFDEIKEGLLEKQNYLKYQEIIDSYIKGAIERRKIEKEREKSKNVEGEER